jgi:hypothetical protein
MRKHLLVVAVILTTGTGCDNVEFGGIQIAMQSPEPAERSTVADVDTSATTGPVNVHEPLLLAGVRDGARGRFVVVGEVHPDALRPFPDPRFADDADRIAELAAPGTEWAVFSEGVRVGRLIVESSGMAIGFCGSRTEINGVVELVATAADAERLLAMPASAVDQVYEEYRAISHVYDQRVATLTIAGDAIPRYGARWPELGTLDARDHLQAFQLRNTPGESVAATFLIDDQLQVGAPGQRAYSLFVMGHQGDAGYTEAYSWYHDAATDGKAAPRYFDHLDWDGDGADEILLDVFGNDQRWFAALSRSEDRWVRSYQDSCGNT